MPLRSQLQVWWTKEWPPWLGLQHQVEVHMDSRWASQLDFCRTSQNSHYPLSQNMCQVYFSLTVWSVLFQVGVLGPPGQQAPPPYPGPHPAIPPVIQQPTTPMFVAPPPKTQRLLHSEAYLKYIEGLSAESNSISKWDQTLAGRENPPQ